MSKEINRKNVKSFARSYLRKALDMTIGLPPHEQQQIDYRKQVCKGCMELGECMSCGCKVPDKFYDIDPCDGNTYPPIMGEEKWEEYKRLNNIKLP